MIVLHGDVPIDAPPDEQDVLVEVDAVSAALARLGHTCEILTVTLDLDAARDHLAATRPITVFNLVESLNGGGRYAPLVAALLEESRLPYTGASLTGLFLTSNKLLTKRLLSLSGISTPKLPLGEALLPDDSRRWITKSAWEHASLGLDDESIVDTANIENALARRRVRFGGEWFAEAYIEGREFNIAIIERDHRPHVLPPAEIRFADFPGNKPRIVSYAAKWRPESFEYRHTARSFNFDGTEQPLLNELAELAIRCWFMFECRGYARVDFRVDAESRPWVLEVNANPCLAPDAGFAAAAAQAGLSYDDVVAHILQAANKVALA